MQNPVTPDKTKTYNKNNQNKTYNKTKMKTTKMKTTKMSALVFLFTLLNLNAIYAQMLEGFESVKADSGQVINGSKGENSFKLHSQWGGFVSTMPILWDTSFGGYWAAGWAISKKIDGSTGNSDFSKHLYCAKPGYGSEKGINGKYKGTTFAVGMNGSYILSPTDPFKWVLSNLKIANTTYAYNSMKNGDPFAKKFGGLSGNDADSFVLKIGFYHTGKLLSRLSVVLADYRFADNSKDYILDSWQTVLFAKQGGQLGPIDSTVFELQSSDNGSFGMNTPGFFAIDEVGADLWVNVIAIPKMLALSYPNPAKDKVRVETTGNMDKIEIVDVLGKRVYLEAGLKRKAFDIVISDWAMGVYRVKIITSLGIETCEIVKQ